jgi:hypothetical protein
MVKLLDKDLEEMLINRHENKINRGTLLMWFLDRLLYKKRRNL